MGLCGLFGFPRNHEVFRRDNRETVVCGLLDTVWFMRNPDEPFAHVQHAGALDVPRCGTLERFLDKLRCAAEMTETARAKRPGLCLQRYVKDSLSGVNLGTSDFPVIPSKAAGLVEEVAGTRGFLTSTVVSGPRRWHAPTPGTPGLLPQWEMARTVV